MTRKDKRTMSKADLEELMRLQDWDVVDLARATNVRDATVYNWLRGGKLQGPAGVLLREWLIRSRLGLPLHTPEREHQPATS